MCIGMALSVSEHPRLALSHCSPDLEERNLEWRGTRRLDDLCGSKPNRE